MHSSAATVSQRRRTRGAPRPISFASSFVTTEHCGSSGAKHNEQKARNVRENSPMPKTDPAEKKKTDPANSAKKKKRDPPKSAKKKKKEAPLLNSPFGKKGRNKKTALYFPNDTLTNEFKEAFKQRGIKHFKPQFRSNLQEPIRYEFEEQEDLDAFNDIWSNSTAAIGNVVIGLKKKENDNVT